MAASTAAPQPGEGQLLLPEDVDDELLARFFSLFEEDKEEIWQCRGEDNCLGFALALSFFRMTFRFPSSYEVIPLRAVNELARQLGLGERIALAYPHSNDTKWEHERRIRAYLGVRTFDQEAEADLSRWIMERVIEGEGHDELRARAEAHLRKENVALPGSTVLDRAIQHALAQADEACLLRVAGRVDEQYRGELLGLVRRRKDKSKSRSPLARLKRLNVRASPASIKELAGRIDLLRKLGADAIDLSGIPPALVGRLARVVEERTPAFFRRMRPERAIAYLASFVTEILARTIDTLLDVDDRIVTGLKEDAQDDYARWLQERALTIDEEGRFLADIVRQLRSSPRPVDAVWERLLQEHPVARFDRALAPWKDTPEAKRSVLDDVIRRYQHFRKFAPKVLSAVEFEATSHAQPLLQGLEVLKRMNDERSKKLPKDAPLEWATPAWRRKVEEAQEQGASTRARHTWETGLWLAIQKGLRAGTLNVKGSTRYRPLRELIYGDSAWSDKRTSSYESLGLSMDAWEFIAKLTARYVEIVQEVDRGFPDNGSVRFLNGRLRLSPDRAVVPKKEVELYKNLLQDHIPPIDLDQLLIDVARRVPYLRHLRTLSSLASRIPDLERKLLICIFGLGCNLDLSRLARSTGIGRDVIADIIRRYFHQENLIDANAELVNYHHALPMSRVWGTGERSGSDGQRHRVRGRSLLAGFLPKYFGHHGRGFTIYRHTSDQYSVFSTHAISVLDRESQFVFDGLIGNRTVLRPTRHSTDTHGESDVIFGLMTLLGYDFCPRIARLGHQRFFRIPGMPSLTHVEPLFQPKPLDLELIVEQWDAMVRIAASMRDGTVAPNVIIRQLENAPTTDRTAQAIKMLGQIAKTLFLLRYIQHPGLRRETRGQLNRCEAENDLSNFVTFAERGVYRSADLDFVVDRSQCTTLVMNNIVIWNTEALADPVLPALQKQGIQIPDAVLAHLSPLMRKHINPYGEYRFEYEAA